MTRNADRVFFFEVRSGQIPVGKGGKKGLKQGLAFSFWLCVMLVRLVHDW